MDDEEMTPGISEVTADRGYDAAHARLYPHEYLDGIAHFNAGRYYEAHESWEEIWLRSAGEARLFYQMLIQAAVGLHHYERGNLGGARSLHKRVCEKIEKLPGVAMSLDVAEFARQVKAFMAESSEGKIETMQSMHKSRPLIHLLSCE